MTTTEAVKKIVQSKRTPQRIRATQVLTRYYALVNEGLIEDPGSNIAAPQDVLNPKDMTELFHKDGEIFL